MAYDDAQFGRIVRKWFGLPNRCGGEGGAVATHTVAGAAGGHPLQFNETQGNIVRRWYPDLKGPVQFLKWGVMTCATLGKGEELFSLSVDGTATAISTLVASTTSAPFTIASALLTRNMNAGSYISILASTNVCSTGSVAIFIDYRRSYSTATEYTPRL